MIRDTDDSSYTKRTVENELSRLLRGPLYFPLEHAINETHRKLSVVEDVRNAVSDRSRYNPSISVRERPNRVGDKRIIYPEHCPVEPLERVVHLLQWNVSEFLGLRR